jgi:heterodisulfide reductase subunit A-like polyferredoxin
MVAVGQHENIDLMTYSEVESISGSPGRTRHCPQSPAGSM